MSTDIFTCQSSSSSKCRKSSTSKKKTKFLVKSIYNQSSSKPPSNLLSLFNTVIIQSQKGGVRLLKKLNITEKHQPRRPLKNNMKNWILYQEEMFYSIFQIKLVWAPLPLDSQPAFFSGERNQSYICLSSTLRYVLTDCNSILVTIFISSFIPES